MRAEPRSIRTLVLLCAIVSGEAHLDFAARAQETEGPSPFRIDLYGSVEYGPVSGFAQIPRGGAVASTTSRKPTLSQMGIDRVIAEDVQLEVGYDGPGIYGGAHFVHLTGSSVLGRSLVSRGTSFPAGSRVRGSLKLDWYRAGGQWALPEARPTTDVPFSIRPGAGFLLLSQAYRLSAASGHADRSFSTGAPELMVDGEWLAIGPVSFFGRLSSTLPFPKLPWIVTAEARVRLRIFGDDPGGGLALLGEGAQGGFLFVGVAFDRVESNDGQRPVPNHIRAIMGPLVTGGIELRY